MPPPSDRPLRKTTMLFFADNVEELQRRYGNGWTTEIREIVDRHLGAQRQLSQIATELLEDEE